MIDIVSSKLQILQIQHMQRGKLRERKFTTASMSEKMTAKTTVVESTNIMMITHSQQQSIWKTLRNTIA